MRMGGVLLIDPAAAAAGDPTHALFADQSHSIPDNLVALLGAVRAWNCSLNTAAGTGKVQWATAPVKGLLSRPIPTEIAREIRSRLDPKQIIVKAGSPSRWNEWFPSF